MKHQIKKWTFRLVITGLVIVGLLIVIILNPAFTYANKTTHNHFSIYHDKPINPSFISILDQSAALIASSEFYNTNFKLDICLNDGSTYPTVVKAIRGQAFAWGFYNKVVMQGAMNCKNNFVELNGYKWNLVQLLAHEMIHCLQYKKLGLFNSNPMADIPEWKWEGYSEYVSRQDTTQKNLFTNITRLLNTDNNSWEILFEDNTISPRQYYNDWLLVQYNLDVKRMSYLQLLADTAAEQTIRQEMMNWYEQTKKEHATALDF